MVFGLLAAFAVRVAAVFVLAFHCNERSIVVIQPPPQGSIWEKYDSVLLFPRWDLEQNEASKAPGLSCGSSEMELMGHTGDHPFHNISEPQTLAASYSLVCLLKEKRHSSPNLPTSLPAEAFAIIN